MLSMTLGAKRQSATADRRRFIVPVWNASSCPRRHSTGFWFWTSRPQERQLAMQLHDETLRKQADVALLIRRLALVQ